MPARKNQPHTVAAEDCAPWEDSRQTRFLLRSLVVMRPREPFMTWVRGLPLDADFDADMPEQGPRAGASAFLVPLGLDESDMEAFVDMNWERFFAQALHRVESNVELWPQRLSWEMMREWFDIEVCRQVFDLCIGADGDGSVVSDLVARMAERFGED